MSWFQKVVTIQAPKRGCFLVTDKILGDKDIQKAISSKSIGLANFFIQHTSAALTVNENYDKDVRLDMEDALNKIAPENAPYYRHTLEGSDDMPAHIKSSLFGASLTIPISSGKLALGTWQGIWLCEFRNCPSQRQVIVTVQGQG